MAEFLFFIAFFLFIYRRLFSYLHFFQQEEYQAKRFLHWFVNARGFDKKGSSVILGTFLLSYFTGLALFIGTLCFFYLASVEVDPRKKGKVRLKMTERATTIYRTAFTLEILTAFILFLCSTPLLMVALVVIQMTPFSLVLANGFLLPFEKRKQARYLNEAKKRLQEVSPFVIGITGSYGKTSTKEALGKILQVTLGPTFWPPKSFNTPMGITREIRQRLQVGYEYAVVEMGAYKIGSIKNLCELAPPQAAIITGVGTCHLDRFGSQENIVTAKSELAKALAPNSILVCNGDNEGARTIARNNPQLRTYFYGFSDELGPLDAKITSFHTSVNGTAFTLHWQGRNYEGSTRLFGSTALSNAIAAFTMACLLGADPDYVLAVISKLAPVDNRLQVKKEQGIHYVHDAYNSNSAGFKGALELMQTLPGSRRIIMTPGMVELGIVQAEENYEVAKLAGALCDEAFVVGNTNQNALVQGFLAGGLVMQQIHLCDTRETAFEKIAKMQRDGDIILIENDLIDIYEAQSKF